MLSAFTAVTEVLWAEEAKAWVVLLVAVMASQGWAFALTSRHVQFTLSTLLVPVVRCDCIQGAAIGSHHRGANAPSLQCRR